jgi:uncharacterized protein YcfJ
MTPNPCSIRPWRLALAIGLACAAAPVLAQITVYDHPNFEGRAVTTQSSLNNLDRSGLNNRASSAVVRSQRWEICDAPGYRGRCTVLRPGQYPSLAAMGLDDRISSVRAVPRQRRDDDLNYAPAPMVVGDYRRRGGERLYQAQVMDARAVYGESSQRCWMEREAVRDDHRDNRVPGAMLGAVIGGILGHQVGGGTGRDIATVGGVVAGAVVGSNLGRDRDGNPVVTRDVQRCADRPGGGQLAYWDVSYQFRGRMHHVQLAAQPGNTVTVNAQGEPRV